MTGDNPGNLITHVQLKGVNYEEWAMAMRTALRAKKEIGLIDGTIKESATGSADVEDWIQQLKTEIANYKSQGQSIMNYFGRLKKLWDELANYERLPVCKCFGCKCNITKELVKRQEEERVHQFVMGLEEETYRMACSNVLATDPLPNVSQVYSIMMREEQLRNISRDRDVRSDAIAFVARQNSKRGHTSDKEKALCGNCGKLGHETNGCFDTSRSMEVTRHVVKEISCVGKMLLESKGKEQPPRVNVAMISSILAYDSKTN
ncbi:retrovirus-related pol polyprotein from transposon TNT 1-94 [Tanacetum coccineum]